nr:DNA translocase FtsK 4TM domain-containing protein [Chloroflexia bacterium]
MASSIKARGVPSRGAGATHRGGRRLPLLTGLHTFVRRIATTVPNLAGTPRFRREVLGVLLVLIALLTASALGRGGDDGMLVDWWRQALSSSVGWSAPMVPLLIGLVALRSLGSQPGPILEARHYLGGAAFTVAVVGLLQLGTGLDQPEAGGYLGMAVGTLAHRWLGPAGAGLGLFIAGAAGVLLLAGTDLQTFGRDLGALGRLLWRFCQRLVGTVGRVLGTIRGALVTAVSRLAAPTETATDDQAESPSPAAKPLLTNAVATELATPAPKAASRRQPPAPPVINVPPKQGPAAPAPARAVTVIDMPRLPLPLPDLTRLAYYDDITPDTVDLHGKARLIEETLASFKVEAWVREINPGPAVTQFALEPGIGTKVRRITELQ